MTYIARLLLVCNLIYRSIESILDPCHQDTILSLEKIQGDSNNKRDIQEKKTQNGNNLNPLKCNAVRNNK